MPGTNAGRRCHRGALRHALVKPLSVLPSLDIKEFLPHATGKIDSITPYHFCGLRRAMWLVQNSPPTAHQEVHMRRVALPLTNEESSWTAALSNVNLIWESSSRANTAVCRPSFEKKKQIHLSSCREFSYVCVVCITRVQLFLQWLTIWRSILMCIRACSRSRYQIKA